MENEVRSQRNYVMLQSISELTFMLLYVDTSRRQELFGVENLESAHTPSSSHIWHIEQVLPFFVYPVPGT